MITSFYFVCQSVV